MSSRDYIELQQTARSIIHFSNNNKVEIRVIYKDGDIQKAEITQTDQNNSLKVSFTEPEFKKYFKMIHQFIFGLGPIGEINRTCGKDVEPPTGKDTIIPQTQFKSLKLELIIVLKENGACIFKFEPCDDDDIIFQKSHNEDDISGKMMSIANFAREMGMESGSGVIYLGKSELHFHEGQNILLVLKTPADLRLGSADELHSIINAFIHEVIEKFEELFKAELSKDLATDPSKSVMENYKSFQTELNLLLVRYHNQLQMIYQKMILTEAKILGIEPDKCIALLELFEKAKTDENLVINVIPDIERLLLQHQLLVKVIKRINALPYWPVFGLTMINLIGGS